MLQGGDRIDCQLWRLVIILSDFQNDPCTYLLLCDSLHENPHIERTKKKMQNPWCRARNTVESKMAATSPEKM